MKYCTICNTKYEDNVSFCALDGEVLEDDPSSLVNETLDGQYHIEAMLGKGGMGAVYRARHILLGDRVAIKVLPPQMRNNAEWLRRFRREGQAARRFRHPNAVTVYDLRTTSEGLIYMVMEYVEGHTLDAELKTRGRFSPAESFSVLEPVMSVLNAAHAMGVVHRDLKPENIMIGKAADGRDGIKLLDLGIAKMREVAGTETGGATALTMAGQVLGTPYYMSPEQWGEAMRDDNPEIDGRADIYSLGLVFYELIAGRRPFCGLTLQELRREHVTVTPRPLHEFLTDVPEEFSRAIARATAKDRGDRQATASELSSELQTALGLPNLTTDAWMTANRTGEQTSTRNLDSGNSTPGPYTQGIPEGRSTNSDLNAPTLITKDSTTTSGANAPSPPVTPPAPAPLASGIASQLSPSTPISASLNAQHAATPQLTVATNSSHATPAAHAQPAFQVPVSKPSRSPLIFIVAGLLGVFLLIGAVGALFIWRSMSKQPDETEGRTNANQTSVNQTNGNGQTSVNQSNITPTKANENVASPVGATRTEALRYWLEVKGGKPSRVAGVVPIASGQKFKFHFTTREDGYLYIIGPGEKNVPTTFLSAQPVPQSGVKTNAVKSNVDFAFPNGNDNWITLDKTTGTENYTIIFSPTPLPPVACLTCVAAHALSEAEQKDLEALRAQYKDNPPSIETINSSDVDPFVSVKIARQAMPGGVVIFDVRIEHR